MTNMFAQCEAQWLDPDYRYFSYFNDEEEDETEEESEEDDD